MSVVSFVNVELPEGADCHCTIGAGVPEACAVNVAVPPGAPDWFVGCVVTAGGATIGTCPSDGPTGGEPVVGALQATPNGPATSAPGVIGLSV